jgi:P-type Ca2+ transporter type 2C
MDVILVLVICLIFSYVLSWLFKKFGLPHILGHMLTGLLLSIPFIKDLLFSDQSNVSTFSTLSNLGLIFLLFFLGLKINLHHLFSFNKKSFNVSMLSALVPFFLGFVFAQIAGLSILISVVIGACLSVTAEVVSISILRELNLMNSSIGMIIIEAGIIDDIFEILILAAIGAIVSRGTGLVPVGTEGVMGIVFDVLIFIGIIYIVRFFFIPFTFKLLGKEPGKSELFTASFIIVLAMAAVANWLQVGTVIGALVAGVVVKQTLLKEHKRREESEVVDMVETVTFGFLEPIFFIWIAYEANLFENFVSSKTFLIFAFGLTMVATGGKLIGSIIGNLSAKEKESTADNIKEGIMIGWGMNARGAVELISAKIALDYGILPPEIYSAIVFMTFATTILSPLVFKGALAYYRKGNDLKNKPQKGAVLDESGD